MLYDEIGLDPRVALGMPVGARSDPRRTCVPVRGAWDRQADRLETERGAAQGCLAELVHDSARALGPPDSVSLGPPVRCDSSRNRGESGRLAGGESPCPASTVGATPGLLRMSASGRPPCGSRHNGYVSRRMALIPAAPPGRLIRYRSSMVPNALGPFLGGNAVRSPSRELRESRLVRATHPIRSGAWGVLATSFEDSTWHGGSLGAAQPFSYLLAAELHPPRCELELPARCDSCRRLAPPYHLRRPAQQRLSRPTRPCSSRSLRCLSRQSE